jgi:C-terminal processing protease CtpA/Prc
MSLVRDGDVAVWMPVGQWLRADQEPIEKNGIVPDEEIEAGAPSDEQDPVLDRALRILASESEVPEEEELEEAA